MRENSDEAPQSEGEIHIPSLAEVERELKRMKLILETKGHLIDPHMKAYLLQEILSLLNKVSTSAESSTSQ
ncbi:hypothetical protein MIMGU_mgv1a017507mg [Erythranthe guttata]|uniref:Uncharacterized protein n=1 Tax=Erythranthe guttata TaxID=4155 RepID=A0A022RIE1_ERYGU|nr:hypothetical protein MIMGU_mgv1a017507mg [Erythranthe guttata]